MAKQQKCIRVYADQIQINACKKKVSESSEAFENLSNLLALAGNEVRLKIMFLLEEENELCPCDISDILGMSVPAVSQHLRKMKDGGIATTRRVAQTIYYSLAPKPLKVLQPLFKYITNSTTKKQIV